MVSLQWVLYNNSLQWLRCNDFPFSRLPVFINKATIFPGDGIYWKLSVRCQGFLKLMIMLHYLYELFHNGYRAIKLCKVYFLWLHKIRRKNIKSRGKRHSQMVSLCFLFQNHNHSIHAINCNRYFSFKTDFKTVHLFLKKNVARKNPENHLTCSLTLKKLWGSLRRI